MKRIYLIIGVALLLFASCGRQQQAKSSVKDFVEQQLHRDVSYLDFSSVDSTRAITDSLIQTLRNRAGQGVQYQNPSGATLLHIRAQYLQDEDTLSATFYLDPATMGVVAYKEN